MRTLILFVLLACLLGCASANGDVVRPDIRVSGTWEGGISHEKGFK